MSEPFLGQITIVGFNFPPRGWAFCEGQILPIAQNTALFSLLGTTYGGDGSTTFALPDLRGRFPLHSGAGPGLPTYSWGQKSGNSTHVLTEAEMPNHSHEVRMPCQSDGADTDDPDGKFPGQTDENQYNGTPGTNTVMGPLTCSSVGGNQAFSMQNPFLALHFCIALTGIFPSRN